VRSFIYACMVNAYCCASYNYASSFLSSGSSARHSYVCMLLSLSFFHSEARDLILPTAFLAASSLWSCTSCKVLRHCLEPPILLSCLEVVGWSQRASLLEPQPTPGPPVPSLEQRGYALFTTSLTMARSVRNCSFSFCSFALSS
jgi:hypothetical protein